MKKTIFLLLLIAPSVFAQSSEQFKKDSTALAEKIYLLQQNNLLTKEQNKLSDEAKFAEEEKKKTEEEKKKTEAEAAEEARVTKLAETTALLEALSAKKPESLSGDITISTSTNGTAECQALIHASLKELAKEIGDSTSKLCASSNGVIVYKESYFKAIPSYYALITELKYLAFLYSNSAENVKNEEAKGIGETIALGSAAIEAITGLISIFKTETSIDVNDVTLNESLLVSTIFEQNNCPTIDLYYPDIYPNVRTETSPILVALKNVEDKKQVLSYEIATNNEEVVKSIEALVADKEKAIKEKEVEIGKEKNSKKKQALEAEKAKLKSELEEDVKEQKQALEKRKENLSRQKFLNDEFDLVYKNLMARKDGNLSLYNSLMELEGTLAKIDAGANVLKLEANAKGTTKITKFIWASTLKHSAFVEMDYQLYSNKGRLIEAKSLTKFTSFKKGSKIK